MKINENVLSIPPYISTTWHHVASIKMKGASITITLKDGDSVNIPDLKNEEVELIFTTHANHIETSSFQELSIKKTLSGSEKKELSYLSKALFEGQNLTPFPLKFGFAAFDGINAIAEHNPLEMNAPDLPRPLIEKLSQVAKIIAPEDAAFFPQEIENCNCFHCQITRAIRENLKKQTTEEMEEIEEEIIRDEELAFNQWMVKEEGQDLFRVTNKLEPKEEYKVFLGTPVGCNCGESHCEHIEAALRT